MRHHLGVLMIVVAGCDLLGDSAEEKQNQRDDEQKIATRQTFLKRIAEDTRLQTVADFERAFGDARCDCGVSRAFTPSLEFAREPLASDTYSAWGCFPATLHRAASETSPGHDGCVDTESNRVLRGSFPCRAVPAIAQCVIRDKVLESRKISTFGVDLKSWKYRRLYP